MTKKKNVNKPATPAKVEASTSVSEGTPPSNEAAAPNDELQSSEILQDAVALVAEHNKETDENKLRFTHQDQIAHKNFKLHETVEFASQARPQKALQIANFSMERGFIGLNDCALVAAAPNITTCLAQSLSLQQALCGAELTPTTSYFPADDAGVDRTLYVSQLFEYKPDAKGNLCWQAQFSHHADYKSDYPKGRVFTLPVALWKALISFYSDLRAGKLPLSFTLPPQGTPLSEPQCSEVYQRWLEYQVQHPLSNICYQVERAPKTKLPGKIGTNERFNPLHLQALGLGAGLALRAAQIYDPESYYQAPSPFAATSDLSLTAGPKLGQVNACSEQKFKRLLALNCPPLLNANTSLDQRIEEHQHYVTMNGYHRDYGAVAGLTDQVINSSLVVLERTTKNLLAPIAVPDNGDKKQFELLEHPSKGGYKPQDDCPPSVEFALGSYLHLTRQMVQLCTDTNVTQRSNHLKYALSDSIVLLVWLGQFAARLDNNSAPNAALTELNAQLLELTHLLTDQLDKDSALTDKLRADLNAQLTAIAAAAATLPNGMNLIGTGAQLSQRLLAAIGTKWDIAWGQELTQTCLKFTQAAMDCPLLVLLAAAPARIATTRAQLAFIQSEVHIWTQLQPYHDRPNDKKYSDEGDLLAQQLMQSLNEVSVELALPPAEPHWLALPPWVKLLAQATGRAEALLQADIKYRKAATIPGAKPQEPATVQANKLYQLCQNAISQAQAADTLSGCVAMTSAQLEELKQITAQVAQLGTMLESGTKDQALKLQLCARLNALQDSLLRSLRGEAEPCAAFTLAQSAGYVCRLVANELTLCAEDSQLTALATEALAFLDKTDSVLNSLKLTVGEQLMAQQRQYINQCRTSLNAIRKRLKHIAAAPSQFKAKFLQKVLTKFEAKIEQLGDPTGISPYYAAKLHAPVRAVTDSLHALSEVWTRWALNQSELSPQGSADIPLLLLQAKRILQLAQCPGIGLLDSLTPALKQVVTALTELKQQPSDAALADVSTSLEQACALSVKLQTQLPSVPSIKPQAALVRNLVTLAAHTQLLEQSIALPQLAIPTLSGVIPCLFTQMPVGSGKRAQSAWSNQIFKLCLQADLIEPCFKQAQDLAALISAESSVFQELHASLITPELQAQLTALRAYCAFLAQAQVQELATLPLAPKLTSLEQARRALGAVSHQQASDNGAAHQQVYALLQARLEGRHNFRTIALSQKLSSLYRGSTKLYPIKNWFHQLQELDHLTELEAQYLGSKSEELYHNDLTWAARRYALAQELQSGLWYDRKKLQEEVQRCKQSHKSAKASGKKRRKKRTSQRLKRAQLQFDQGKSLCDYASYLELKAYLDFKACFFAYVNLKERLINLVTERQGTELTDILATKCINLNSHDIQMVLRERKDHAVKQLWGLIENQIKAKGKQRSAFKKACDTIKERIAKRLNELREQLEAKAQAKKGLKKKPKPQAQPAAAIQPKEDELSRKLKVLAESSDRLIEYSLSAEFFNPKSFNFFTGQYGQSTTYLEFSKPQPVVAQGDDSKSKKSGQDNESKEGAQSTGDQAHNANGNELQVTAQPDEGSKSKNDQTKDSKQDKKVKQPPALIITLVGRAMGSDGRVHKMRAPIKFKPKGRGKLWYHTLVEHHEEKPGIQQTSLLFQVIRYKNKRANKRIVVSSCLKGRAPCFSQQLRKAFAIHGMDIDNEEQMNAWLHRKVAIDMGNQVLTFMAKVKGRTYLDFFDILYFHGSKSLKKKWAHLHQRENEVQAELGQHQAQINPKLATEQGRISKVQQNALYGTNREFCDQKSRELLNQLRAIKREIVNLRDRLHFGLICKIIPYGGVIVTELMNYSGLMKRRQVKGGTQTDSRTKTSLVSDAKTTKAQSQKTRAHADSVGVAQSSNGGNANKHQARNGSVKAKQTAKNQSVHQQAAAKGKTKAAKNSTSQSKATKYAQLNPAKSRPGAGGTIANAAPASFISDFDRIARKLNGMVEKANTPVLKATKRNPFLEHDDPRAFSGGPSSLSQRHHEVVIPDDSGGTEQTVTYQRDALSTNSLYHSVHNSALDKADKKKDKGKSKDKQLNDVDRKACLLDKASFDRAHRRALERQYSGKANSSQNIKKILPPREKVLPARQLKPSHKRR